MWNLATKYEPRHSRKNSFLPSARPLAAPLPTTPYYHPPFYPLFHPASFFTLPASLSALPATSSAPHPRCLLESSDLGTMIRLDYRRHLTRNHLKVHHMITQFNTSYKIYSVAKFNILSISHKQKKTLHLFCNFFAKLKNLNTKIGWMLCNLCWIEGLPYFGQV